MGQSSPHVASQRGLVICGTILVKGGAYLNLLTLVLGKVDGPGKEPDTFRTCESPAAGVMAIEEGKAHRKCAVGVHLITNSLDTLCARTSVPHRVTQLGKLGPVRFGWVSTP
nr:ORF0 [Maize-associated tombusvirus]